MLFFLPLFCGQAQGRPATASHIVELIITPFDPFTRSSGLDDDKVYRAAAAVLTSQGFVIDEKSSIVVSVTISSRPQSDEDFYPFKVEVHAGTRRSSCWTMRMNDGDRRYSRSEERQCVINNDMKIIEGVRDVVATVASKLQRKMDRISPGKK
jgi:hypothetical protein